MHRNDPLYGGGLAEAGDQEGKTTGGEEKKMGNKSLCWPNINEAVEELISLYQIVWPIVITSFLLYSRSVVSMLFLGHLGDAELAGGSLAIAFANITGYSVLKGLAMGMDPICGPAFGAKRWAVLRRTFQKTILLLLLSTIPISVLWINMEPILLHLGQDPAIFPSAKCYLLFSFPDLLAQSFLHPLRIFLKAQSLTTPLTFCAALALILHIPINWLLISYFNLGVKGVALASALNTVNINMGLVAYLLLSEKALKPWHGTSLACFQEWAPLVKLAAPSMVSVCLEWWWYEVMLILCGLLSEPQPSVAAMGILIQTTGLMYVIPSSLGMGLSTRVGHELGAGQPARARRAASTGLVVAMVFGLAAFVFTVAVRGVWGRMFTGETRILALTAAALPIVGFCELGNCPQTAGCGVLRGSARPTFGANINFSSFYLVGLPVAAVAGFRLGLGFVGLWLGLVAAQASCASLTLYAVARTDWEAQVERAEELTGGGFGDGEEDDLEASLLG
ncbi:protein DETOXIFICATION 53-like [Elaeis guineensis]|uniref:Protein DETOXIFICATION n=1 Tax=Elaeis guineensis var. tenera TaxID=51953 RepID=A0A6I9R754_ELAGV|nr:protein DETOXIFICATION 53 [Elaeis guineensis]